MKAMALVVFYFHLFFLNSTLTEKGKRLTVIGQFLFTCHYLNRRAFRVIMSSLELSTTAFHTISYPEPSNFLRRMLDENEGLWKGLVLKVHK